MDCDRRQACKRSRSWTGPEHCHLHRELPVWQMEAESSVTVRQTVTDPIETFCFNGVTCVALTTLSDDMKPEEGTKLRDFWSEDENISLSQTNQRRIRVEPKRIWHIVKIFIFFFCWNVGKGCKGTKSVIFRSTKLAQPLIRIQTGNPFQRVDQSQ